MSTSSGRTALAAKSRMSSPQGTSGVSAGRGPSPVSIRIVRPPARIRYEPRLNRTLCSSVRCDSYGCQLSPGIVGKKLQRSNSSSPSDSIMISTLPTRTTLLVMSGLLGSERVEPALYYSDELGRVVEDQVVMGAPHLGELAALHGGRDREPPVPIHDRAQLSPHHERRARHT